MNGSSKHKWLLKERDIYYCPFCKQTRMSSKYDLEKDGCILKLKRKKK